MQGAKASTPMKSTDISIVWLGRTGTKLRERRLEQVKRAYCLWLDRNNAMPADFVEDPVSLKMLLSQLKIVDVDWHKLKMSDLSKGNDALEWLNTELAEWKQDFDAVEKFSCDIK